MSISVELASFIAVLILAVLHLVAGKLRFLEGIPRSRWLSFASGSSVAYVFVRLLPELSAGQDVVGPALGQVLIFAKNHVYLVALSGLVLFYGVERMVRGSQKKQGDLQRSKRVERQPDQAGQKGSTTSRGVFWLHSLSFLLYNFLIGYLLLHRERPGLIPLILFASAMGFHFVVTDFGLRKDQKEMYTRLARWLLAGALVSGWLVGLFISISKVAVAILVAFLAGGVILNVMKEELPEERESRFFPFLLGAAGYAALLLLI